MTLPVIYLDIDGVLNGHNFNHLAESNIIETYRVKHLNWILLQTDARIVLSSAWRYMIHDGAMTLTGFEYLLRTHGLIAGRLIGATCLDETQWNTRGRQIASFHNRYVSPLAPAVVIDDGDDEDTYGLKSCGIPWVRTNGKIGLTRDDAWQAIMYLSRPSDLSYSSPSSPLSPSHNASTSRASYPGSR